MKIIQTIHVIVFVVLLGNSQFGFSQIRVSGILSDATTKEEIIGAQVDFPDLKREMQSDIEGKFEFLDVPIQPLKMRVNAFGYKEILIKIDFLRDTILHFQLERIVTEKELDEVVITAQSQSISKNKTPISISTISPKELERNTASNIIDALTQDASVSQMGTGPGISKPIIRGLGFNRVVVVQDGMRQEGQQWGDEHGVEIDEYSVHRVEIIKGASSLSYGGDAVGGVINMMSEPSLQKGKIQGGVLLNYQSNNGLLAGSVNLAGKQKGIGWNIRYSRKMAHDYRNAMDGYVFNSGFTENAINGSLGITKRWGYSTLNFGMYDMKLGIVEGERDSLTGNFIKEFVNHDGEMDETLATKSDFLSYRIGRNLPYQKIRHYKATLTNRFILKKGFIDANLGWQQNRRMEFEEVLHPDEVGLSLLANTLNYHLNYHFPVVRNWDISVGANGQYQFSVNQGEEYLIPDYRNFTLGTYGLFSKTWNKWTFSGGVRYDYQSMISDSFELEESDALLFPAIQKDFHGIAASAGMTYSFTRNLFMKLNLSKGFRPPNIAELASNGVHEGTVSYVIGNSGIAPENNLQTDFSIGWNSEHVTAEIDIFHNFIHNFIYLQRMMQEDGTSLLTEGVSTYQYTSGNVHLFGGELVIDFHPHPLDWLHVKNSFGYVEAMQLNQSDSTKYLPFIPAPKWNIEIMADRKSLGRYLQNGFIKLGFNQSFTKTHIHSAYQTETVTPYYLLIHLGVGVDFVGKSKQTIATMIVSVDNLLNRSYQSHLNRFKYLSINPITGNEGVYNMGRNFSVKLIFPIQIK